MRILVTGSHGLVGSALMPVLQAEGHEVISLVRSQPRSSEREFRWNPSSNYIDLAALDRLEAVIHLAGENLASGRWTEARKDRIRNSRVQGTRLLCGTLARLKHPPRVLLCASAVGYYGSRADECLTEESSPGKGFLAELCQEWESETSLAKSAGIRAVQMRFGVILSNRGGALARMLLPFKLGLGGPIGGGHQFWSWIAMADTVAAIRHALLTESLRGPVNLVSPHPVTNREFSRILGQVLGRPAFLPVPGFALRIALGEMAEEALLGSARVLPGKLLATGFHFRFPELGLALAGLLTGGLPIEAPDGF